MNNGIDTWIYQWFLEQNDGSLPTTSEPIEELNYFELGLIDSLGIITLIDAIEHEFDIALSHNHFEQRRFSTMKGLSEIISEERKHNGTLQ